LRQYKPKVCLVCGKKFIPTNGRQKHCEECIPIAHKEYEKQYNEQYYLEHQEQQKQHSKQYHKEHLEHIKQRKKQYDLEHSEHIKQHSKQYYLTHREQEKERNRRYYKENSEKRKEGARQYLQTEKGKEVHKRKNNKRRELGFIPLNQFFEDAVAHHIDKERVIYIPEIFHVSVPHCLETGNNMDFINEIAYSYLYGIF
jgi:hypothetical protein